MAEETKIPEVPGRKKLLVFDKNEVLLLFLFTGMIAVTSFTFGVKIGKEITFRKDGFESVDEQKINLKSPVEEEVDQIAKEKNAGMNKNLDTEDYYKDLQSRLKELENENPQRVLEKGEEFAKTKEEIDSSLEAKAVPAELVVPVTPTLSAPQDESTPKSYYGKWTVQLGAYKTEQDAKEFADGFVIKGYNPIIYQVDLKEKGLWYRVSLGVFDTMSDAQEYVVKEESLFQGQDYIVTTFK